MCRTVTLVQRVHWNGLDQSAFLVYRLISLPMISVKLLKADSSSLSRILVHFWEIKSRDLVERFFLSGHKTSSKKGENHQKWVKMATFCWFFDLKKTFVIIIWYFPTLFNLTSIWRKNRYQMVLIFPQTPDKRA